MKFDKGMVYVTTIHLWMHYEGSTRRLDARVENTMHGAYD